MEIVSDMIVGIVFVKCGYHGGHDFAEKTYSLGVVGDKRQMKRAKNKTVDCPGLALILSKC